MSFAVEEIVGKGKGLVATAAIEARDVILQDRPLVASQTPSSRLDVLACGNSCCLRPVQDTHLQLQFQLGHCPREQALAHGDQQHAVWCEAGCGECYCSDSCRAEAAASHRLICTGLLADDCADEHPLIRFKLHALQTSDMFLLCAAAVARVISGDAELKGGLKALLSRSACWWDVALMPEAMVQADVPEDLFRDSLMARCLESATLLQQTLQLQMGDVAIDPELFDVQNFYGPLMGTLERYNMGVRIASPVVGWFEQLASASQLDEDQIEEIQTAVENMPSDSECGSECSDSECGSDAEEQLESDTAAPEAAEQVDDGAEAGQQQDEQHQDEQQDEEQKDEQHQDEQQDEEQKDEQQQDEEQQDEEQDEEQLSPRSWLTQTADCGLFAPVDGVALFGTIGRANHSCEPNARVEFGDCASARLVACSPIAAGEEITISYLDEHSRDAGYEVRSTALSHYGFQCGCRLCKEQMGEQQPQIEAHEMGARPRPFELTELPEGADPASSIEQLGVGVLAEPVLDPETVAELHAQAIALFDALEAKVAAAQGLEEPFRFKELCWRGTGRYDARCQMEQKPWAAAVKTVEKAVKSVASAVVGDDCKVIGAGVVMSRPGSGMQGVHQDGPHLFGEDSEYPPLLPAHCLNVFVPLVDLTPELGSTRFFAGSHRLSVVHPYSDASSLPELAPYVRAGSGIMFDYRVAHRGEPNISEDTARPVLYVTIGKPWFVDQLNFPTESLHDL